jgi:membrane protein implicated in regulation of membrane protease activity
VRIAVQAIAAIMYALSTGVTVGAAGIVLLHSVEFAVRAALVGFAVAATIFAYVIRRTNRRPRPEFLGRTYRY